MAPKVKAPLNVLQSALDAVGTGMNQYFKYNFGAAYTGIPIANTAIKAGLKPSAGFATSLAGSSLLTRAINDSLPRAGDPKPFFGDGDQMTWADNVYGATAGVFLPRQGKIPNTYDENTALSISKGIEPLSESAYEAAKIRDRTGGWMFRINRDGEGSEIAGRDTATLFGSTVSNPLYRFDSKIGSDNVDRITTAGGLTSLGVSLNSLREFSKSSPPSGFGQTAKVVGGSLLKGVGTAAAVYGAIDDFSESKKAGDSDLRAVANSASSTGGTLAGAYGGAAAAATVAPLAGVFAPAVIAAGGIAGGVAGSGLGGWLSDRALDLFGEGKNTDQQRLNFDRSKPTFAVDSNSPNSATLNRQQRDIEDMTPQTNKKAGNTTINSARPSDYGTNQKLLSDYENFNQRSQAQMFDSRLQSGDRRFGITTNADVSRQNNQLQSSDRRFGITTNADTQRYGINVNAGVTRELGFAKTFAELEASLDGNRVRQVVGIDSNTKQLEGVKYKVEADKDLGKYQWNNINQTALAEAQIKAGTYGRSQSEINALNTDKYNRQVAADYESKMMNYAKYQNEITNMNRSIGNSERAYSDQRMDMQNARTAATVRYNQEMEQKIQDKNYDRGVQARERDLIRQDKSNAQSIANALQQQQNLFRQQELSFRQQQVASDVEFNRARTAQIYSDTKLRSDQFGAGRSDISYNRSNQATSFAF